MRFRALGLPILAALALAACAPASTTPASAPAPERRPTPRAPTPPLLLPPDTSTAGAPTAAPRDWQLLDMATDHVPGISLDRAERELLAGRAPAATVLVAVIDGGIDTAHVDLRPNLWVNGKETPANHADDDADGYADDVYGWNFIGGADGRDVHYDTQEITRLHDVCLKNGNSAPRDTVTVTPAECARIATAFAAKRDSAAMELQQIETMDQAMTHALAVLHAAIHDDSLTTQNVTAFQPATDEQQWARNVWLQLQAVGITASVLGDAKAEYAGQVQYGFNTSFDPRPIVGDDYPDVSQRHYGNGDVMGPDAMHGTHVAGIIGAARGNGTGIDGIAPAVRIMMVRAVPQGDERDKDIANAIRFAVDHGARVINMSFGKPYSPYKGAVDAAVKYADAHGVLMVHAAGNDGQDNDSIPQYPTPAYLGGGRAQNWIEVGASTWQMGDSLAASFSNYGKSVDVFAPGVDILSTVPGNGYERESGTSMATPVVTGLAALIMSYYPSLSAADVKRIILQSAVKYDGLMVVAPGPGGARVPFGTLSATGGIVNAYNALRLAGEIAAGK